MTFFKQLERLRNDILSARSVAEEGSEEHQLLSEKLAVIINVANFIKDGNWAKDTARERLIFALREGYSAAARHYETTVESIKSSVFQASEKLRVIYGYPAIDILGLIEQGKTEEAAYLAQLRQNGETVQSLFCTEVNEWLPYGGELKKLDRSEFVPVAEMLRSVTTRSLIRLLTQADGNTLEAIIYLLTAKEAKYASYQVALYAYLMGEFETGELCRRFNLKQKDVCDVTAK